jgi:hypothetical protein
MVKATAVVLLGRWNITLDQMPVGIGGANGRRACNAAPVLLMADGIVPLRTPAHSVVVKGVRL